MAGRGRRAGHRVRHRRDARVRRLSDASPATAAPGRCQTHRMRDRLPPGRQPRTTALRRYREIVCLCCAALLWAIAWSIERTGYSGATGRSWLAGLGVAELLFL